MGWKLGRVGILFCLLAAICQEVLAQVRWDGEAHDGVWNNPVNWVGDLLPGVSDIVILDNSVVTSSYAVQLADGGSTISVLQIQVMPAAGNSISLSISPANTLAPALVCTGEGYGLNLGSGATFQNSSGAASGAPLEVADSIRIGNGAKFIHNTPRSHAANVRALSRAPGTEDGEFEFRIPVASSTISVSGQVFGRLKLSPGPIGTINYTGTGTNDLTIRSDLEIAAGVNLNFNLEGQVLVGRNFIQHGGACNLGTTARLLEMNIGRDLIQAADAIITETGTARPRLRFIGPVMQNLNVKGRIENEIILEINNTAGLSLDNDLSIPHLLILNRGRILTGSFSVVITGTASLEITGHLLESFIEGKIKKEGLISGDFVFPVGKNGIVRWVSLKNATGNFLVEFIRSDPRMIDPDLEAGLSHISGLEHWRIEAGEDGASASVELSFDNVNSGGVTSLDQLRVAHLNDGYWRNAGNVATTGSAGGGGSVVSASIDNLPGGTASYFTLASSQATQNPLPVNWNWFRASAGVSEVLLEWSVGDSDTDSYVIERSADGRQFEQIGAVSANPGKRIFMYRDLNPVPGLSYYRVAGSNASGKIDYSGIASIRMDDAPKTRLLCYIQSHKVRMVLPSLVTGTYFVMIYETDGKMIYSVRTKVTANNFNIQIPVSFSAGKLVIVRVIDPTGKQYVTRTIIN